MVDHPSRDRGHSSACRGQPDASPLSADWGDVLIDASAVFVARHSPPGVKVLLSARMKTCPDCNGDGVVEKGTDDEKRCPTCGGSGVIPDDDDDREEVIKTRWAPHRRDFCEIRLLMLRG